MNAWSSHRDHAWRRLDPFYQHGTCLAAACDTGWASRRNSNHATTALLELPTGLPLAIHFTTKLVVPALIGFEDGPGGLITMGFKDHSTAMDPEGTKKVVATLLEMRPACFEEVVLTSDGDAKCPPAPRIHPRSSRWKKGACYCHLAKNTEQNASMGMSKQPCPGHPHCPNLERPDGLPPKGSCSNATGNRWRPELNRKLKGRLLQLLKATVRMYQYERCPRLRERRRAEAKVWFRRQLVALVLHFSGDHSLCISQGHGMIRRSERRGRRVEGQSGRRAKRLQVTTLTCALRLVWKLL